MNYRSIIKISFDELRDVLKLPEHVDITGYITPDQETRTLKIAITTKEPINNLVYETGNCNQLCYVYYRTLKELGLLEEPNNGA